MSDSRTRTSPLTLAALLTLAWLGGCSTTQSLPGKGPYLRVPIIQGMLGVTDIDEEEVDLDDSLGAEVDSISQTLPLLGAAVQYPVWGGERFQLGFEGGSTIAWDRDTTRVFLGNGTVVVRDSETVDDVFPGRPIYGNCMAV